MTMTDAALDGKFRVALNALKEARSALVDVYLDLYKDARATDDSQLKVDGAHMVGRLDSFYDDLHTTSLGLRRIRKEARSWRQVRAKRHP